MTTLVSSEPIMYLLRFCVRDPALFFFSSRRRHTGSYGDWSSDVCSSDLGGMVSFRVRAGEEAAVAVCGRTRLFILGESLGGVESLIEHPGRMTHASAAGSPLEVPADLVRLSVGIESADDLLEDLRHALS